MASEKVTPTPAPAATPAAETATSTAATNGAATDDTEIDGSQWSQENNCRMYENKYPEADDLVIVQVKNVAEMGAYVSLLEYNSIEGMILLSELSRRRIRSINKLIRVGRQEIVVVLRVDKDKGYIDLSKRRVSPEDIVKCEEKYNKSKAVHSIMRHVSETCHVRLEELYVQFGWDLYKRFGHAYDAFKLVVSQSEKVLGNYKIRDDVQKALLANIKRRLTPQAMKVRADLEVTCFSYEGIDAIKAALRAGEAVSLPDMPVKIKLVAPPLYVMMTTTLNKEKGIALLTEAIAAIEKTIKAKGGDLNIKTEPRAVSERDDRLLSALMETLEKQNQEVAGDDEDVEAPAT
jgi:translation initiation factor 2 subunit 1